MDQKVKDCVKKKIEKEHPEYRDMLELAGFPNFVEGFTLSSPHETEERADFFKKGAPVIQAALEECREELSKKE